MMNKNAMLLIMLIVTATAAFSPDFSLRPSGSVFSPAGAGNKAADGNERFDIGGGGELGFDSAIRGFSRQAGCGENSINAVNQL